MKKEGFNKYKKDMPKRRTSKRACYECGEVGHFIADYPNKQKGKDKEEKKSKPFKKDKYKTQKKKYSGQAQIGEEWDSNSDSDDEGVATIAIHSSTSTKSLFDDMSDEDTPKCLTAKGRKVKSQSKLLDSDNDSDNGCESMLKGLSKNTMSKFKELMEKIEGQEEILEK
ncbi:uncharacterized protein LOC133900209 [Phragmites australis]|uniref:uncharacterized protein LOC133900209 n=1 Tax=Phragmites australis TaxID=29695 RepID=UPI002D77BF53|nr:uncharacterized protein LOC133900209 [Phragmites australis]